MAKISNQSAYPSISPADSDFIIGTDASDDNATKTFDFSGIFSYINDKLTDPSMTPVYASEKVVQEVRFAEAVSKGDPVYISGYNVGQNRPEVSKADASDAAQMPSIGLASADYSINTNGYVISVGDLIDVDTDALGDEGDIVYVASGGGLTVTKPTGSNLIQNVGKISRSNQNNGSIEVFSVGRTNDVPNLSTGKIWVGSAANTIESAFVTLDESGTTLDVAGDIEIASALKHIDDTGTQIEFTDNDTIALKTDNTTRVNVNGLTGEILLTGNVGINENSPGGDLHVGGNAIIDTTLSVGGVVTLNNSDVKQTTSQLDLIVGSLEDSMLELNANSGDWSWRIGEETSVTTITGASGSGNIDITSSGQIMARFNGGTPTNSFIKLGGEYAANTLDDYEEGTFTPSYGVIGTGTITGESYFVQDGWYVKIGSQVNLHMVIVIDLSSATVTGTGNLKVTGLPFSIFETSGPQESAINASVGFSTVTAGFNDVTNFDRVASTEVRLRKVISDNGNLEIADLVFGNTNDQYTLRASMSYRTTD